MPKDSSGSPSPQRSAHKRTQATPSAPLSTTETSTDQQSPLDDEDETEPQVRKTFTITIKLFMGKMINFVCISDDCFTTNCHEQKTEQTSE